MFTFSFSKLMIRLPLFLFMSFKRARTFSSKDDRFSCPWKLELETPCSWNVGFHRGNPHMYNPHFS